MKTESTRKGQLRAAEMGGSFLNAAEPDGGDSVFDPKDLEVSANPMATSWHVRKAPHRMERGDG
jgi:hypothetical protein